MGEMGRDAAEDTATPRTVRPNPSLAVDVAGFAEQLRLLKVWAGDPSLDRLRQLTGVPRSTLSDALSGERVGLPTLENVERLLRALGLDETEATPWVAAWNRIQAALTTTLAGGAESDRARPASEAALEAVRKAPVPRLLPEPTSLFVGRDDDLAALGSLLAEDAGAVAAICGPAGSGKTALTVHWAHQVADRFPDGQLYLNLGGFGPGEPMGVQQALAVLLRGLGVPGEEMPGDPAGQAALYRSLLEQRRVLVVLDDAAGFHQVRMLLPASSACLTLVTSRDPLTALVEREGARRLQLGALPPAHSLDLLAGVLGNQRLSDEPESAWNLSGLCAHLPLALRIAAAYLAARPNLALATYVRKLGGGRSPSPTPDTGAEESAVHSAFDVTYDDLDPLAQRLFRRLSHITGSDFAAPTVSILINSTEREAERLLGVLVTAHLVELVGPGRYAMVDLLRFYAGEQLRSDEDEQDRIAVRRRLFSWYLHSAAAAVQTFSPAPLWLPLPPVDVDLRPLEFDDPDAALAWLDSEHSNLLTLIAEAAKRGPQAVAWHVVDVLSTYLGMRAHRVESVAAAQIGLEAAMQADDRDAEAAMYMRLGQAQDALGDAKTAVQHALQAIALSRTVGDQLREAFTLISLGDGMRKLGRPEHAGKAYVGAGALFRELGQSKFLARVACRLGLVQHDLGRLGEAAEALRSALRQHSRAGDKLGEAETLGYLAGVLHDAGRDREAMATANRAVALSVSLGPAAEADACIQRAMCRLLPADDATGQLEHALELARSVGYRSAEARGLLALAELLGRQGEISARRTFAEQALALARTTGYRVIANRAEQLLA
ncbi:ATP-binding protein [Flindersiella endophytica]